MTSGRLVSAYVLRTRIAFFVGAVVVWVVELVVREQKSLSHPSHPFGQFSPHGQSEINVAFCEKPWMFNLCYTEHQDDSIRLYMENW